MRVGVVILAGGEATRLPGKLALDVGGLPLIVRVFRNLSPGRETFVSCKGTFPAAIDSLLDAPLVVDRWSRRGPLAGLVSTLALMRSAFVFAVAGDAPLVGSRLIDSLAAELRSGDEAVVPEHARGDGGVRAEPLAALYDRVAFLREGAPALRSGRHSLLGVLERLRLRRVRIEDARQFTNINASADYAEALRNAETEDWKA